MARSLGPVLREALVAGQERIALIDPGITKWTYAELAGQVDRYKTILSDLEWGKEDTLGLFIPKRAHTIAIVLAALEEGIPFVPCDSEAPIERARKIFKSASSRFIIVTNDSIDDWQAEIRDLRQLRTIPDSDFSIVEWQPEPTGPIKDPELAYILYTSGSTGEPKGVQITSENALAFIEWASESIVPGEGRVFTSIAPLHFDLSVFDIYVSLLTGGRIVLFDGKTIKNPRMVAKVMADERVNIIYSTPTIFKLLLKYGKIEKYDWSFLEIVIFAGEVFQVSAIREIRRFWQRATWYNLYGPTETNVVTWYELPTRIDVERTEPFPIGETCPYAEYILRDESGGFDRDGIGELLISGASVMPGYVGDKGDNLVGHDGRWWYPTGDWVRVDDSGELVFLGRHDGMVKRNGYRIELGEIERAYAGSDGHDEAIAFPMTDGEHTYIVLALRKSGEGHSQVHLKEAGLKHLPVYMLPDFFIYIKEVPMTSSQKVDYQELKNIARDRFFS